MLSQLGAGLPLSCADSKSEAIAWTRSVTATMQSHAAC
ncbi:MAG: hypothetical protein JWP34_4657 [Massilia sp.]|nr:hypothetical protein [Massilia sp.]